MLLTINLQRIYPVGIILVFLQFLTYPWDSWLRWIVKVIKFCSNLSSSFSNWFIPPNWLHLDGIKLDWCYSRKAYWSVSWCELMVLLRGKLSSKEQNEITKYILWPFETWLSCFLVIIFNGLWKLLMLDKDIIWQCSQNAKAVLESTDLERLGRPPSDLISLRRWIYACS